MYTAEDIEDKLNLDREKLIALALFCGCDYVPKGVPGVGYTTAVKYFKEVQDESMLKRSEKQPCIFFFSLLFDIIATFFESVP